MIVSGMVEIFLTLNHDISYICRKRELNRTRLFILFVKNYRWFTIDIGALTPLKRTSRMKMDENVAQSIPLRTAKKSYKDVQLEDQLKDGLMPWSNASNISSNISSNIASKIHNLRSPRVEID